ncbi:MAG: sigma-54-dependent Fis family transcriptional regulator [Planctomyces sp.]|nr:sigma-54-dependent Fis family transcriptional regulator [Planctomyces sp.]
MSDAASSATIRLTGRVAVWSRDERARNRLALAVQQNGYEAVEFASIDLLRAGLTTGPFSACVLDEPESPDAVRQMEQAARQGGHPTQFVVLPSLNARSLAFGGPICDVLEPPQTAERLGRSLFAAVGRSRLLAENLQLKRRLESRMFEDLVGHSEPMETLRRKVGEASEHERPVLVVGEAGSGTSIVSRAVHLARCGGRRPFLKVCCEVLSAAVVHAELFGDGRTHGRLASAQGGTLLLEDIEALALPVQEQLARVLEDKQFKPTGSDLPVPLQVRIIASTHADLAALTTAGKFHPGLLRHFRMDVIPVPPLRDRLEDVSTLAEQFLTECAVREGQPVRKISPEALDRLRRYHWPENCRELQNVISRCCSLTTSQVLTAEMVEPWLERAATDDPSEPGLTLREMERKLIEATFNRFNGNRELTAKALRIGLRTLSGKLREYGYPPRGGPGSNRESRAA